nr:hypothetical protein [Blautia producta]
MAEKVGYKDYKYFSAYFNKLCGCSAKEYKHRSQAGFQTISEQPAKLD